MNDLSRFFRLLLEWLSLAAGSRTPATPTPCALHYWPEVER